MKRINLRYNTTKKALDSFKKSVEKLENAKQLTEEEYRTFRDSAVKRFEISVDTLWKYVKIYLEAKKGLVLNSPKPIFRECLRTNLISESEAKKALEMVDARNMTSHIYKEEIAEQIRVKLPDYYKLMNKLITTMKP